MFVRLVRRERVLFSTGDVVATPGVMAEASMKHLAQCLKRHVTGDWGLVCADDAQANEAALEDGSRIISVYPVDEARPDEKMYVITEADRSYTTILLPEEY